MEKKRKPGSEMSASSDQEEESPAKRRKTAASKQSTPHRNTSSSVTGSPESMTSQSSKPRRDEDNEQQPKTKKGTTQYETKSVSKRLDTGTENIVTGPVGKAIKNTGDEKMDSTVVIPKLVGYDISSTEESDDVPCESTEKEQLTNDKIDTTSEDKSAKTGVQPKGKKEMKSDKSTGSHATGPLKNNSRKTTVRSSANASNVKVKPETRRTRKSRISEVENCLPVDNNDINSDGTKKATRRSLRTRKS